MRNVEAIIMHLIYDKAATATVRPNVTAIPRERVRGNDKAGRIETEGFTSSAGRSFQPDVYSIDELSDLARLLPSKLACYRRHTRITGLRPGAPEREKHLRQA